MCWRRRCRSRPSAARRCRPGNAAYAGEGTELTWVGQLGGRIRRSEKRSVTELWVHDKDAIAPLPLLGCWPTATQERQCLNAILAFTYNGSACDPFFYG